MTRSPSERILEVVAANSDRDIVALPPLYDAIDPESLDQLIKSMDGGSVSFIYADSHITVTSDRKVTVSDSSSGDLTSPEINCDD
jgi:hypothetical protein